MKDLDDQIALAVALMKDNKRCADVRIVQTKEGFTTNAFVCIRTKGHLDRGLGHEYEEVTKTIPMNWRSNANA